MKQLLVVTDLDMRRHDTMTEFIRGCCVRCGARGMQVTYVLPTVPCAAVLARLAGAGAWYTVLPGWRRQDNPKRRHNIRAAFALWGMIRKRRIDLVSFNFCAETMVIVLSLLLRLSGRKRPLIWHQHDEIEQPVPRTLRRYLSRIRIMSWFIHALCPVYRGQEDVLRERGIPREKIATLYNGTDLERFDRPADRRAVYAELGLAADNRVIITVGSLIPRKGIEYFLRAAAKVQKAFPRACFLIAGDGPLRLDLAALAQELGIGRHVRFLGMRSDVDRLLGASDIFVLSALSEAFPFAIIEAMAAGKPVVATRVGGVPEAVRHNETGLLIAPGDSAALTRALLRLVGDEQMCRVMGDNGRRIVKEQFSVEKMVDRYVDLYRDHLPSAQAAP